MRIKITISGDRFIKSQDRSTIFGFVKATAVLEPPVEFPPPEVPRNFNSMHKFPEGEAFKPVVDLRIARFLTAEQRGILLGETQLKGGVFDLLAPSDRVKLEVVAQAQAQAQVALGPTPSAYVCLSTWKMKGLMDFNSAVSNPLLKSLQDRFAPAGNSNATTTSTIDANRPFKDDPGKQRRYDLWVMIQRGQVEVPEEWHDVRLTKTKLIERTMAYQFIGIDA